MGCNCGGKRAGLRYLVQRTDGSYDPELKATLAQAQAALDGPGATFRALSPAESAAYTTRQGASA
jgi:hypothetical protein